ncbi:hypothetical protein vseg_010723 [Gypsophila vaccaria]
MGICHEALCMLCQEKEESSSHLFFQCTYSTKCAAGVQSWLEVRVPYLMEWNVMLYHRRGTKLQRQIQMACVLALCHSIWAARNTCRVEAKLLLPEVLVSQIKWGLKTWLVHQCTGLKVVDLNWLKKKLNIDIYL